MGRHFDTPWSHERIQLLLSGEALRVLVDERDVQHEVLLEGPTSFELREAALAGASPELILDPAQLDQAVSRIVDREVRCLLGLMILHGCDEWQAVEAMREAGVMRSGRQGNVLLERGIQLIARSERSRFRLLRRVRAHDGTSDAPVCWRCLKVEVVTAGEECGSACPALRDRWANVGRPSPYEPSRMTVDELAATQKRGPIPGGRHYEGNVVPYGTDPTDVLELYSRDETGRMRKSLGGSADSQWFGV